MVDKNELANALEKLVNEHVEEKKEEIKKITKDIETFLIKWDIIIRALRGEIELPEEEIRNLLCFKSLAYCCGLQKNCIHRDIVRALLGIDDERYVEMKNKLDEMFMGSE